MKKLMLACSLVLLCPWLSMGQNKAVTIKGHIADSTTKSGISRALVITSDQETATDNKGNFTIMAVADSLEVTVEHPLYRPVRAVLRDKGIIYLEPVENELEAVIVTANRDLTSKKFASSAVSRLSSKAVDETKAGAMYELLNKVPGVLMQNYNNEQHGMSIRQPMGTSAYYLYLEDGLPLRPLGIFNHNALLEVNQYAIDAIEVVRGPSSSLYGAEAIGGTVNMIMKKPPMSPTIRLGFQADSWGFERLQFAGGATHGKFGYYLGGLYSRQQDSWITNSDYEKTALSLQTVYKLNERTRITSGIVYGKYFSQTSGSVDSTAFYSRNYKSPTDFTYRQSRALRSRIALEHRWDSIATTVLTLYHRYNELGQNPSYGIRWNPRPGQGNDPTKARGEVNLNLFRSYGTMLQHRQDFELMNIKVVAGASFDYSPNAYDSHLIRLDAKLSPDGQSVEQYTIASAEPDNKISFYQADIYNTSVYSQVEAEPLRNLKVILGGRYDRMSYDYLNKINNVSGTTSYERFTPKTGLVYLLSNKISLYTNYAQGFSPPALTSVFRPRPGTDAGFYTNLDPSVFTNIEMGARASLFDGVLYLEAAFYHMRGQNELLNIRQPDNSFDYQSAGKTIHRGVEFEVRYKPEKQFLFRLGGTYAEHRFRDFAVSIRQGDPVGNLAGYTMPAAPYWIGNAELQYYPRWLEGFRAALEWQYLSSWYQNQVNTVRYEGYQLLNARAGYRFRDIEVYGSILNLADKLYANAATRGNNGSDRSTFNPGAPRTFTLGMQYNFN